MVKTVHCSLSSQPGRGDQLNLICPAALLNEQSQRGTGAVGVVRLEKTEGSCCLCKMTEKFCRLSSQVHLWVMPQAQAFSALPLGFQSTLLLGAKDGVS